jgi:DNA-binding response OmpR family regulator
MTDILIVDDDSTFGQLTLERIESMGYSAVFHHGPFGTVNAIRAARPRLVILDVNMPGLDGPQINQLVRSRQDCSESRILLMSSMDQRELDMLAKEHAIDGALHKSASRAELRAMISRLIGA